MKLFSQPRNSFGALVAGVAVLIVSTLSLVSCGDTFRPVANPEPPPGGDPQALHLALVVNNNNGGAGSTTQVNVSGDTNSGNFPVGRNPVHAAFVFGASKAAVVNKADDTVSTYAPTSPGTVPTTATLPAGAAPVFVQAAGATNMFIAGSNPSVNGDQGACGSVTAVLGCVYVVGIATDVLNNSLPVGRNPVALATTPDGLHVYSVNQGDGTVTPISVSNLSISAPITVGLSPIWAVSNAEGTTLYVANQGDNTVSVIDTASNTVTGTLHVGAGPRFLAFDGRLRRLYVANTGGSSITVFNVDVNPPADVPLATIAVGNNPTAITPLADGTRVYVANAGCQDRLDLTTACTGSTVSVIDSNSLRVRKTITVGTGPVFLDSSPDSIRVEVVNRDSNNISSIRTSDDTVINTLPSGSPTPLFVTINR